MPGKNLDLIEFNLNEMLKERCHALASLLIISKLKQDF